MRIFILATLLLGAWLAPATALESDVVRTARTSASLVSEADSIAPGKPVRLALRLRIAPGWHSYWQNPGDAGAPPTLDFTLPAGATAGPLAFPVPERQPEGPLVTYGYQGEILLPVVITGATAPFTVTAQASWLVCKDICVPEEASFHLTLPAGAGTPGAQAALFAAADRAMPRPAPFTAHVSPTGQLMVDDAALRAEAIREAWFIPDSDDQIANAAPQGLTVRPGHLELALTLAESHKPAAGLSGLLLLRDAGGQQSAVELHAAPAAEVPAPLAFWRAIAFALLGGVILNLMPCVFPILAMKAIGLAHLSGAARRQVRLHALSYTAGVLVTFAALGGVLLILRAAGSAAGWGFQFQSPAFVAFMAWVLFTVGLSLSGALRVGSNLAGGLAGTGDQLVRKGGHLGSFFTGLLAVLVATPCTAPFMGVAIAAALAAPMLLTLLVFIALGVGLAAPTLLLAAVPALADALPKPGRWMEVLKQALAFPMYGAAIWLVWVVAQSAGPAGVLAALAGLLLIAFGAWITGVAEGARPPTRRFASACALFAMLAAAAILTGLAARPPSPTDSLASVPGAEPFSLARLTELRAAGRPVFVNMTAAWCVTCLVNERLALGTASVRSAFAEHHVAYLVGDWTRQDQAITDYLRSQDRDGVPLYVLYPANGAPPTQLPQILTESGVLDALHGAGG